MTELASSMKQVVAEPTVDLFEIHDGRGFGEKVAQGHAQRHRRLLGGTVGGLYGQKTSNVVKKAIGEGSFETGAE